MASATLIAGQDTEDNGGVVIIRATPIDPPVAAVPESLTFTARFVNARCVYVGPEVCTNGQEQTGSNTVASLIDFLCNNSGGQDQGLHVTGVFRFDAQNNPVPLRLDEVLQPAIAGARPEVRVRWRRPPRRDLKSGPRAKPAGRRGGARPAVASGGRRDLSLVER